MPDLRTLYRKHRLEGMAASSALACARHLIAADAVDFPWPRHPGDKRATFDRDGFTIRMTVAYDEHADLSHLGTFSDRREPGAIAWRGDRNAYKYFIPTISEQEHYRGLRDMKYGKAQAREAARANVMADFRQMKDFDSGASCMYGVIVTASRRGIELGQDDLWGVDDSYILGAIMHHEMIDNAIAAAREALADLCAAA